MNHRIVDCRRMSHRFSLCWLDTVRIRHNGQDDAVDVKTSHFFFVLPFSFCKKKSNIRKFSHLKTLNTLLTMIIRVRTNVGQWRVEDLDATTAKVSDLLSSIAKTRPNVKYERPLSMDPGCSQPLDTNATLAQQGLGHGSMIHAKVDPSTTTTQTNEKHDETVANGEDAATKGNGSMKRIIAADGSIKLTPTGNDGSNPKGFRKGMLPLRDMKMSWTLQVSGFVPTEAFLH